MKSKKKRKWMNANYSGMAHETCIQMAHKLGVGKFLWNQFMVRMYEFLLQSSLYLVLGRSALTSGENSCTNFTWILLL